MAGVSVVEILAVLLAIAALMSVAFLIATAVRWALGGSARGMERSQNPEDPGPSAQEVLDRRYAAGEVSREEYQIIRDDITRKQNA
jgi:uncharacterized membrane protein